MPREWADRTQLVIPSSPAEYGSSAFWHAPPGLGLLQVQVFPGEEGSGLADTPASLLLAWGQRLFVAVD